MIADVLATLGGWNWLILGLILLGIEMTVPGFVFLWLGIAALVTGVIALVVDIGWQAEVILFVVLSIALLLVGRSYFRREADEMAKGNLNRRGAEYIGRTFELGEDMRNGSGRLYIGETYWRVRGETLEQGTRVKVVATDGPVLVIERT